MQQEGSHEWLGRAVHQPHMASAPGCVGFGKMHDMNESPGFCLTASPPSQALSPLPVSASMTWKPLRVLFPHCESLSPKLVPVQRLQVQLRHMISHQRAYIGLQGTRHLSSAQGHPSLETKHSQHHCLSHRCLKPRQGGRTKVFPLPGTTDSSPWKRMKAGDGRILPCWQP